MDVLSDLANLLITLKRAGVSLRAAGPTELRASPASALTPDLRARIKAHKPRILTWLRTGDLVADMPAPSATRDATTSNVPCASTGLSTAPFRSPVPRPAISKSASPSAFSSDA